MLHSNKFYFGLALSLFFSELIADRNVFLKSDINKVDQDFPSHKNLSVYLISLERVIDFALDSKEDLDLNFSFGIFLVQVNLKPLTLNESLPIQLRNHLKSLLYKVDKILSVFNNERDRYNENGNQLYKISTLFKNDASWLKNLPKLSLEPPRGSEFSAKKSQEYPEWRTYVKLVDEINKWVPCPRQSDTCMGLLAETEETQSSHPRKCKYSEDCYKILISGSNFGYGLTHRLLFLLLGRLGRECIVSSAEHDKALRQSFCRKMYKEAEYIAYNEYRHVDLMFEQIALCTLDGHAEFLRKSWLFNLLRYQTSHGCFGQKLPNSQHNPTFEPQWQSVKSEEVNWKHDLMNKTCNAHVTAAAVASLAAAVRFALENY